MALCELRPFQGKVVHLWAKDPIKGGVIEDARVVQLGSRTFIVGELVPKPGGPDPRDGSTYWFPLDEVLGICEYRDMVTAYKVFADRENRES